MQYFIHWRHSLAKILITSSKYLKPFLSLLNAFFHITRQIVFVKIFYVETIGNWLEGDKENPRSHLRPFFFDSRWKWYNVSQLFLHPMQIILSGYICIERRISILYNGKVNSVYTNIIGNQLYYYYLLRHYFKLKSICSISTI